MNRQNCAIAPLSEKMLTNSLPEVPKPKPFDDISSFPVCNACLDAEVGIETIAISDLLYLVRDHPKDLMGCLLDPAS